MNKKAIALLCALSLLISAFAVPSAAATTKTSTSTDLIATSIPTKFPFIKQDSSFTIINFWHAMGSNNGVLLSNISNWYNSTQGKKNKIYVKPIYQGDYASISIKVSASIQSGSTKDLPDVLQGGADTAFIIKDSKYILYVEDLMNADKTFKIKDQLNKNQMWACSYKGKQLGMPFSNSVCVLHYNADAFAAVGIDVNDPPKTLAELATYAVKLGIKGTGKKPVRNGFSKQVGEFQLATWLSRQKSGTSGQFDNAEGRLGNPTKYIAGSDGSLKDFLTEWKKVVDTGYCDYLTTSPYSNFAQGLTAMYTDTMVNYDTIESYFLGLSANSKTKAFDHRIAAMPSVHADDAVGSAIGGSALYMLDKGDETKKKAAWDFMKFVSSVDVSAYWSVNSGYFPMNNSAIKTKYMQDKLKAQPAKQSELNILLSSANNYKFQEPWMATFQVYKNACTDQITLFSAGKQTADKTVENITKKAQYLLDTYNKANS